MLTGRIIEVSDDESEPETLTLRRFTEALGRPHLRVAIFREVHKSRNFRTTICWVYFDVRPTTREALRIVRWVSRNCQAYKIGVTRSPLWRFYSSITHVNGMRGHAKTFDFMLPLVVTTPALAAVFEKFLVKQSSEDRKNFNFAKGGESLPRDQSIPIFVYMVVKSCSMRPPLSLRGSLELKREQHL